MSQVRGHALHARARESAARTPSRSPATSCATTSPTCSRSWNSAPAPRCCRSCRRWPAARCSRPAPAARHPSTSSSWSRKTTCAGTRSASSWRWPRRSRTWARRPATRRRRCSPNTPGHRHRHAARQQQVARRRKLASSTTAAATSTWRCTGPRPWRRRPKTSELQAHFAPLAKTLAANEQKIVDELKAVQGQPADIGGYYKPDRKKTATVMRPSATFNAALASAAA